IAAWIRTPLCRQNPHVAESDATAHTEPQLHLIQPRAMLGREVKHVLGRRLAQKRPPWTARPQLPGIERNISECRDPLAHFHAPMRVQLVHYPVKAKSRTEMPGYVADMPSEIGTGPPWPKIPHHLTVGHHKRGNQRPRAVAEVFKLPLLG